MEELKKGKTETQRMDEAKSKFDAEERKKIKLTLDQEIDAAKKKVYGTVRADDGSEVMKTLKAEIERLKTREAAGEKAGKIKSLSSGGTSYTGKERGELYALNEQYRFGRQSLEQYNTALKNLEMTKTENDFKSGKISIQEYNEQLNKMSDTLTSGTFQAGVENYIKASGTLAANVAAGITQTFSRLEDSLFEFVKTGQFEFRKFTQAILDDLTKIIIRAAIVRPLAGAALEAFGGAGASGPASGYSNAQGGSYAGTADQVSNPYMAAKGAAFDGGNLMKFASGGVVSSPTLFSHSGGRSGLMGEAGTEAIIPLRRGKSGNLGVEASIAPTNVTVNVVNNSSDVQATTKESKGADGSRIIDVMIVNKVKEGIANGMFDKQFSQTYGMKRRGT
jgi:lambda family phage tail tape measure protein